MQIESLGDSVLTLILPLEFRLVSFCVLLGLKLAFAKILTATGSWSLTWLQVIGLSIGWR